MISAPLRLAVCFPAHVFLVHVCSGTRFSPKNRADVHKMRHLLKCIFTTVSWQNLFLSYPYNKDADQPAHSQYFLFFFEKLIDAHYDWVIKGLVLPPPSLSSPSTFFPSTLPPSPFVSLRPPSFSFSHFLPLSPVSIPLSLSLPPAPCTPGPLLVRRKSEILKWPNAFQQIRINEAGRIHEPDWVLWHNLKSIYIFLRKLVYFLVKFEYLWLFLYFNHCI